MRIIHGDLFRDYTPPQLEAYRQELLKKRIDEMRSNRNIGAIEDMPPPPPPPVPPPPPPPLPPHVPVRSGGGNAAVSLVNAQPSINSPGARRWRRERRLLRPE